SEAEKYFNYALNFSSTSLEANFGLGRVLYKKGDFEKAKKVFFLGTKLYPQFQGNYYYLAKIYQQTGETEKSIETYRQALKQDSHFVELRLLLSEVLISKNLFNDAFVQLHRLNKVDKTNSLVNQKLDQIRPLITKKEEELVPAKKLTKFFPIRESPEPGEIVKIGLNTDSKGNPIPLKQLILRNTGGFNIVSKNEKIFETDTAQSYKILFVKKNEATLFSTNNEKILELQNNVLIVPQNAKDTFIIEEIEFATGFAWAGKEDRQYRGMLELKFEEEGIFIINHIRVEEYLYSVLPSEMIFSWPMEALKAQSVVARTYLYYRKEYVHPHKKVGYDLCDSQHCQVYSGINTENKRTSDAVDQTYAEVLVYNNKFAHTMFHSNCGGHTQGSNEIKSWANVPYLTGVFDGDKKKTKFPETPYELELWLKTKPDVYCNLPQYCWPPEFRWFRIVPIEILEEKINREKNVGKIKNVSLLSRSSAGNLQKVLIEGTNDSLVIELENKIKRLLGIGPLRSTLFWLETDFNPDGSIKEIIIYGGGWGHGVGMCQTGAAGMATKGFSYQKILQHYYPGTVLKKIVD
ncbi:MAG: SpoIID/LytB domain-containing protein, partial [Endomicrobiia bacterium]